MPPACDLGHSPEGNKQSLRKGIAACGKSGGIAAGKHFSSICVDTLGCHLVPRLLSRSYGRRDAEHSTVSTTAMGRLLLDWRGYAAILGWLPNTTRLVWGGQFRLAVKRDSAVEH